MHWNNPTIEVFWPCESDPLADNNHHDQHCLFWNPTARFDNIKTNQRLCDLASWANQWLQIRGLEEFAADSRNHYDIANLVKLNMWIHDIRKQGIVKPWLIQDHGDGSYVAGTGDSRLRCLERIPEIQTVPAFITTHKTRAHLYRDLEPVTTFNQFARYCGAQPGQLFLLKFTDRNAPYGMYWYEYNSRRTRSVTPASHTAVAAFVAYYRSNPDIVINESWFDNQISWDHYMLGN